MAKELLASPRLWPDPDEGPWLVQLRLQVIKGRLECVGINVTSARPEGEWYELAEKMPESARPFTTAVWRSLRVPEMVAEERERLAAVVSEMEAVDPRAAAEVFGTTPAPVMRESTRKRLSRVAGIYREAWQQGKPPVKAVAKRLGINETSASSYVARARAAGFLPPTTSGVPAGSLEARSDEGGATPST